MNLGNNNNKGMSPMVLLLGAVCCCCVLCSSSVAGLYVVSQQFKDLINGLLGYADSNERRVQQFVDAGCTFTGLQRNAKTGKYECANKNFPKRTKAIKNGLKDNPTVPGTTYKVDDIQCVANQDCLNMANSMFE